MSTAPALRPLAGDPSLAAVPDSALRRMDLALAPAGRRIAAFDADGTLWSGDLGERFLRMVDVEGLVPPPPGCPSVFDAYEATCERDVDEGYASQVDLLDGVALGRLDALAAAAWQAHRQRVSPAVAALVAALVARGVEVWIVSASPRWCIAQAAADPLLRLGAERVIAMEGLRDEDAGVLRGPARHPRTNGPGKVLALRARVDVAPRLAFGNSVHDGALLDHAALGVRVAGLDGRYATEALDRRTTTGGWIVWAPGDTAA